MKNFDGFSNVELSSLYTLTMYKIAVMPELRDILSEITAEMIKRGLELKEYDV